MKSYFDAVSVVCAGRTLQVLPDSQLLRHLLRHDSSNHASKESITFMTMLKRTEYKSCSCMFTTVPKIRTPRFGNVSESNTNAVVVGTGTQLVETPTVTQAREKIWDIPMTHKDKKFKTTAMLKKKRPIPQGVLV